MVTLNCLNPEPKFLVVFCFSHSLYPIHQQVSSFLVPKYNILIPTPLFLQKPPKWFLSFHSCPPMTHSCVATRIILDVYILLLQTLQCHSLFRIKSQSPSRLFPVFSVSSHITLLLLSYAPRARTLHFPDLSVVLHLWAFAPVLPITWEVTPLFLSMAILPQRGLSDHPV